MTEREMFRNTGEDFSAFYAAEAFLKERGFSVGPLERGAFVGVRHGECIISKWSKLDAEEREDLHGFIKAGGNDFRRGTAEVIIRSNSHSDVLRAFRAAPVETMPILGIEDSPKITVDGADAKAQHHVEGWKPDQRLMVDP